MEHPEQFDTVTWQRKETIETGMIREIRGQFADIMTGHGDTVVETAKLSITMPRKQWNPDALRNHLHAVYGLDFPFSLTCQSCDAGSNITSKEQAKAEGWIEIEDDITGLSWSNLGICPCCQKV